MARIFVSHSSTDEEQSTNLLKWLHDQGFHSTFLDFDKTKGIAPGAEWEKTLYRELTSADAVLLVLTKNWFESKWCFVEFAQARALGKAIFPLIETPTGETFVSSDIQHLDLVKDREGGMERLRSELTRIALNSRGGFSWDNTRAPYPGLLAFDEADAAIYFGRDDDIRRLIERLNARRAQGGEKLVVVLGASGSGKSSLVRAGVVPRLKRDNQGRNWIVLPAFRPQLRPLDELAQAIATALGRGADWRQWRAVLDAENLRDELSGLARDLRFAHSANEAQVLVVIDQGEELFTDPSGKETAQFLKVLNAMLDEKLPFLALVTLRSDYLGQLQQAQGLGTAFEEFSLKPMPLERVREIIEGPARVAGIAIDDALVTAAMRDAATNDALPLLAFALRELYDRFAKSGRLTLEAYQALGDPQAQLSPLENSVKRKAEEILGAARLSAEDLRALKDAFIPAMVRVNADGEYARRPAKVESFSSRALPMIERLAKGRLLTIRQEGPSRVVEVTHEALLRKWPLLRGWLDEEREFLLGKEQLEQELLDWEKAAPVQKHEALLSGLKLTRARTWLAAKPQQLTEAERNYIEASIRQATRRARLRRIWWSIALATSLCVIVGFILMHQVGAQEKRDALVAESESAADEMERNQIPVSLAYLADVLKKDPTNERATALAIAELRDSQFPLYTLAHLDEVQDAEFSQDGTRVVTASADGTAQLWDARTGNPIGAPMRHTDWVHYAKFSNDGKEVITASWDGTAGVWDGYTGLSITPKPLGTKGGSRIADASLSPDGTAAVTASYDGVAQLWNVRTGEKIGPPMAHASNVWTARFSADGAHVVTASADGTAGVWDSASGNKIGILKDCGTGPCAEVNIAEFSPDGKWIVTGSDDGKARIWDAHSMRLSHVLVHEAPVNFVSFSPEQNGTKFVVTASSDGTARVWNLASGAEADKQPMRHSSRVRSAKFSGDGKWIVTASYDRTARVWNAREGEIGYPVTAPLRHGGGVYMADFSPADSSLIVTASFADSAEIWRWRPIQPPPVMQNSGSIEAACFDSEAGLIATADDSSVQLWDAADGRKRGLPLSRDSQVAFKTAACSRDGKWLVTVSNGQTELWNIKTGQSRVIAGSDSENPIKVVNISSDDRWVIAVTPHEILLYDAIANQLMNPIVVDAKTVLASAAVSPDGQTVAAYTDEGHIKVWNARNGQEIDNHRMQHDGRMTGLNFSQDGKWIVTSSADHTARIWNVQTGEALAVMKHDDWVQDAEFSPDGKWIATACANSTARVWDAQSGQPVSELMRHKGVVMKVSFSPDGRWVVTASDDGTAEVWDAQTGVAVSEPISHENPDMSASSKMESATFSPDGKWIIATSQDDKTGKWEERIVDAPITAAAAPSWLAPLSEALGGSRLDANDVLQSTSAKDAKGLQQLREALESLQGTEDVAAFGRWLAADPATRPLSPRGN